MSSVGWNGRGDPTGFRHTGRSKNCLRGRARSSAPGKPGPRICPLSVSPWLPCSFTSLEFLLVIRQHKIAGTLGGQWQKRHKECAIFLSADALLANGDLYIIWLLISQSSL